MFAIQEDTMFAIQFAPADVALCNTYGLTQWGVCAVVLRDGIEVYRTRGFAKRAGARAAAQDWIGALDLEANDKVEESKE